MVVINGDTGIDKVQTGAVTFEDMPAGSVIQVANYTTGANSTTTSLIPLDNTIPQITEGTQIMSLAFTPKKANSKLKITVVAHSSNSATTRNIFALFVDDSTSSIGTMPVYLPVITAPVPCSFVSFYNVVSTSTRTFSVRLGVNSASTATFNGESGSSSCSFGGSLASSITIEEIAQ